MNGFEVILPFLRPIESLILNPDVSEIMVNGSECVFIERAGFIEPVPGLSLTEKSLMIAVKNIARRLGSEISEATPILDSRGAKVIDRLATDLRKAFPDMAGFSPRNLKYMRAFAEAWPDEAIVQQLVAQIPWGHLVRILDYVKAPAEREWYIRQTIESGWSRNVLVHHIESGLYRRQGKALTNFTRTLPAPQSELAQQVVKDPYNFDFLTLSREAQERELEHGLLDHIRDFLLELGVGFAFVGSQHPLQVGGEEFRIDLLFYHLKLRAYVIIDLKMEAGVQRQDEFLSVSG